MLSFSSTKPKVVLWVKSECEYTGQVSLWHVLSVPFYELETGVKQFLKLELAPRGVQPAQTNEGILRVAK